MGDRYYLENKKCPYCGFVQLDEIFYAPTCSIMTYRCENEECDKHFFITFDFEVKKIEDVKLEDVKKAISDCSTMMDEEQIERMSEDYLEDLNENRNT
jgi:hypothetical protein